MQSHHLQAKADGTRYEVWTVEVRAIESAHKIYKPPASK